MLFGIVCATRIKILKYFNLHLKKLQKILYRNNYFNNFVKDCRMQ